MKRILMNLIIVGLIFSSTLLAIPPVKVVFDAGSAEKTIDNTTYINANNILMFVTNHGNFGRDLSGVFGTDYGTYYPYISNDDILNGLHGNSVLYAAGLWMGGKVNGETRLAIAEYSDEYVPGPMVNGQSQSDRPEFRVYKLYSDSLDDNPNNDYLNWPVDQGAPVDEFGQPQMMGDQMLWSAFNDANQRQHDNDAGNTAPLGIEVQQTVWASDGDGEIEILGRAILDVTQVMGTAVNVKVNIVQPELLTGHDYTVTIDSVAPFGAVWNLIDVTLGGAVLLENQTNFSGDDNYPVIDGFQAIVTWPDDGGLRWSWTGGSRPITGVDWGGSVFFGGVGLGYEFFGSSYQPEESFTIEMRWHGDGQGQSAYCYRRDLGYQYNGLYPNQNLTIWDVASQPERQLNFAFIEYYDPSSNSGQNADGIWNPGEQLDLYGGFDPLGGREYFFILNSDYSASVNPEYAVDAACFGPPDADFDCVISGWVHQRGFSDGKPDPGDVWQFDWIGQNPGIPDTFNFVATAPEIYSSDAEGMSIYIQYKLINKGGNTIDDFYFSLWSDPDLGQFTDDLVGCDTLDDLFFYYNGDNSDNQFGALSPACGFKLIHGPVVPSPGDQADFNGTVLHNYKNLGLTAFAKYINGTDPDDFGHTYNYMQGLQRDGTPLPNGTSFAVPGDPVTGTGDIDTDPQDVRMMGSCGPFQFLPGDSQFVLLKFAVGQGDDRLSSITNLKANLNYIDYPETELTATLTPDPQSVLDIYANETFIDTIFVARAGFDAIGEIDFNSIRINESLVPLSVTSYPSWDGFNGEVLALIFYAKPFLVEYGLIWDVPTLPFTVSGQFADESAFSIASEFTAIGLMSGDANGDGGVNVGDAVFLINYVYKAADSPDPLELGDADCDGTVNVGDVVYLVDLIFKNGPSPATDCH